MSEASDITGSKGCHGGLSTLLVCLLLLASPLLSDVAQTPGGRVVGDVAFAKASLSLTGKPIAWQDLVWFSRQQAQPLQFLSSAVGFAGGDRVAGKIIDLQGDSLGVQSSLIGRRNLPLEQLSAMEFLADSLPATLDEKGVLYRQDGEPVPGGILWMDGRQIALDSPLGMLMIKRPQASAYVFDVDAIKKAKARKATTSSSAPATTSAPAKPTVYAADADFVGDFEVSLIDGSRLHGRLAPQDGAPCSTTRSWGSCRSRRAPCSR